MLGGKLSLFVLKKRHLTPYNYSVNVIVSIGGKLSGCKMSQGKMSGGKLSGGKMSHTLSKYCPFFILNIALFLA